MNSEKFKFFLRRNINAIIAYCVLLCVLVLFAYNQADFFTVYGPQSIFNQIITLCVATLGQTIIILTSGIDLSMGNLIILTNCVSATIFMPITNALGGSILFGGIAVIIIVLLVGALAGLLNGCFVVYGRLQPIVVTLATSSIFSGLARYVRPTPGGDVPREFARFFTGRVVGVIPMSAIILAFAIFCIWLPYRRSRAGQSVYAIGSNEEAAFLNGINIKRSKLIAYMIAGLCAGICGGVLLTAQIRSGDPTAANNFTNNSIAASVLGGVSLMGGKGTYFGSIAGAAILSLVLGLLIFWNISSYYQNLIQGIIMILALSIASFSLLFKMKKIKKLAKERHVK